MFSVLQWGQIFGVGFSDAGWPHFGQNFAFGGMFLSQLAHWLKTSC
jgi:membrane associated rhomboid family serine protease